MKDDLFYLQCALSEAEKCAEVEWFAVGCVLVAPGGEIVSAGFTGERRDEAGNKLHAEEVALEKAEAHGRSLSELTLYSSLEPCSKRRSKRVPCAELIANAGVRRVVFAAKEPYEPDLGIVCEGEGRLRERGVKVRHLIDLSGRALAIAWSRRRRER